MNDVQIIFMYEESSVETYPKEIYRDQGLIVVHALCIIQSHESQPLKKAPKRCQF